MEAPHEPIKTAATYLTASQVAELLQLDPSTVYRLAASDTSMPATRIGNSLRFHAAALERWLAAKTQKSRRTADPASVGRRNESN